MDMEQFLLKAMQDSVNQGQPMSPMELATLYLLNKDMHRKHDNIPTGLQPFNAAQTLYGPGGLFQNQGQITDVVSTIVRPMGLGHELPAFPSVTEHHEYGFLTGISDDIGDEPTEICGDAPTGYLKGGTLSARFGRVIRDTETIEIGSILRRLHRGEATDIQLYGTILNDQSFMMPSGLNGQQVLDSVVKAQMIIVGTLIERKLAKMLWSGSPANSTPPGYVEFPGIETQVRTGIIDAVTGVALPSADSLVIDGAYGQIGQAGFDLIGRMEAADYFTSTLVEDTVGQVEGIIVMRPELWWAVSQSAACRSALLCQDVANENTQIVVDARQNLKDRDSIRAAQTLSLNGKTVRVVTDSAMPRSDSANDANLNPGEFASDIYYLPLRIAGRLPTLYWEHLDFRAMGPELAALRQTGMPNGLPEFWTDAGRFLWAYHGIYSCFKLKARIEPRVILRTPQLAWRIDNVKYTVEHMPRDWDPTSPYWVDGGVSLRTPPVLQAAWL